MRLIERDTHFYVRYYEKKALNKQRIAITDHETVVIGEIDGDWEAVGVLLDKPEYNEAKAKAFMDTIEVFYEESLDEEEFVPFLINALELSNGAVLLFTQRGIPGGEKFYIQADDLRNGLLPQKQYEKRHDPNCHNPLLDTYLEELKNSGDVQKAYDKACAYLSNTTEVIEMWQILEVISYMDAHEQKAEHTSEEVDLRTEAQDFSSKQEKLESYDVKKVVLSGKEAKDLDRLCKYMKEISTDSLARFFFPDEKEYEFSLQDEEESDIFGMLAMMSRQGGMCFVDYAYKDGRAIEGFEFDPDDEDFRVIPKKELEEYITFEEGVRESYVLKTARFTL